MEAAVSVSRVAGKASGESASEVPAAYLSVRGITHRFRDRTVLDGLSFDVGKGEIFGLLGPNGSGKSTTFHILTGMLRPAAGEVFLSGSAIAPGDRSLRARAGVVFQSTSVDPKLTARENLSLTATLHRMGRTAEGTFRAARPFIQKQLELSGLADRADEPVRQFSGGMKRRLDLARALLSSPELLIMDEPTAGLDEVSFHRIWDHIRALRAETGLTVLLTTHRPEEAERCDRLAVLDSGRVIATDSPEGLKRRVSGDVITLSCKTPSLVSGILAARFGLTPETRGQELVLEHERGHELIPRMVEALPEGELHAVSMRRPTLADVFARMTGRGFFANERVTP